MDHHRCRRRHPAAIAERRTRACVLHVIRTGHAAAAGLRRPRVALETPLSLRSAIRDEARKLDPQMAIDIERASDIVDATLSRQRLGMTLMLGFGIAAVALAAVGIYGVIAYGAAQRRNEVAIRLALGATPSQRVLAHAEARAHAGCRRRDDRRSSWRISSGRLVSSWLYEVQASDPMILGAATTLVVGIALVATMIPAYRAARLDPARVLRPNRNRQSSVIRFCAHTCLRRGSAATRTARRRSPSCRAAPAGCRTASPQPAR